MNIRIPYKNLSFQVIVGILLGILVGVYFPSIAHKVKIFSDIFIRLITLVVGPIVFCTIVSGISSHDDIKEAGKIGFMAIIYFEIITTFALILGLISTNLLKPGVGIDVKSLDFSKISQFVSDSKELSFYDHILHIFPGSIFDALARNDLLQILFFSVIFGISMALLDKRVQPLKSMLDQFGKVMFKMLHLIIHLAPLAAFGAMGYTITTFGLHTLVNFAELILSVYLTILFFVFFVLGGVCYFSRVSLWSILKHIKEEILITIGTSSSESVLPRLIEKLEAYGCSKEVVGLVIPTGYSFNLDGTSIYLSAAAIFIAQAYGIHLSIMQQFMLLLLLMINSKGAAAVTGGGFVTLAATLSVTKVLPVEGMVLLLGIDRLMSEARAITNVIGNSVATVVISKWDERKPGTKRVARMKRSGNTGKIDD